MVAEPALTPLTKPLVLTVAIAELELLHEPPETLELNCRVEPTLTEVPPEIAPALGNGFTVTARSAVTAGHPPEAAIV